LQDWRDELSKPDTDQLYPELLRYADVVGATCIGAATVKELEDLDFDLAIIDEAGQIDLPNLLVPLVRAKRAVLVGDHHQLPPFVASEVQTWLHNLSSPLQLTSTKFDEEDVDEDTDINQITDLATKSAFEQLFTATTDRDHIVRFTKQGRMPRVIADFVSQHFYNNQLHTFDDARMQHTIDRDPLFRRHLVVIDTSDEPSNSKWETPQRRLESLGETGYVNIAEARLIARIAEIYQKAGRDWIVIVPYRAQARRIIQELKQRLDDDTALEERIATVHSFQGGERNKVIYGFTRSNREGKIGFLNELRLLNVAMTRARQQLVLVGNYPMLTRANDAGFRQLVASLYSYTGQHGERLLSAEAYSRIREAARGKDWQ
jgi:superfamily I DNA and/or RNA helicase